MSSKQTSGQRRRSPFENVTNGMVRRLARHPLTILATGEVGQPRIPDFFSRSAVSLVTVKGARVRLNINWEWRAMESPMGADLHRERWKLGRRLSPRLSDLVA